MLFLVCLSMFWALWSLVKDSSFGGAALLAVAGSAVHTTYWVWKDERNRNDPAGKKSLFNRSRPPFYNFHL